MRQFAALAGMAVVLILGLYVVNSVYVATPNKTYVVDNQSITQSFSWQVVNQTVLDIAEQIHNDAKVWNATGVLLTAGTDYSFSPSNCSIIFYNTTSTSAGAPAKITFSYEAKPEMMRNIMPATGSAFSIGAVALIVLIAGLILAVIGSGGGNTSRGSRRGKRGRRR